VSGKTLREISKMRFKIRPVFPIIALLALFSLGENPVVCSSFLQNSYLTEWVSKTNTKTAKCIHFARCLKLCTNHIDTFYFTPVFLKIYYQKLSIIFFDQTQIFKQIAPLFRSGASLFAIRISIDHHIISGSESASVRCLISLLNHGLDLCNIKINGLWSNQPGKLFSYYIFSS
jgi:hypothetical protein